MEKEVKRANTVRITGYLKENTLEQTSSANGNVIRGALIISTDKICSHKVQFYTSEYTFGGEPSKLYESLLELLPEKTTSIASYLKNNPGATFEDALTAVDKIWTISKFDEYATRSGERESSMISVKGFRAGLATEEKFTPHADFDIDIYINDMHAEEVDGKKTDRLVVQGAVPKFGKTENVDLIDFVAGTEDNVASYIKENYKVGDTVHIKGDIISIQERKLIEQKTEFFGKAPQPQYETKFIRERLITGGSKKSIHNGEEGCISSDYVKSGLATRSIKMDENGAKKKAAAERSSSNTGFQSSSNDSFVPAGNEDYLSFV